MLALLGCTAAGAGAPSLAMVPAAPLPPAARTVDVVETLGGQAVADPYRWMEGESNAEFGSWLKAQGEHTARELARSPGRDGLFARLREVGLGTSRIFAPLRVGERIFILNDAVGAQVARLEVKEAGGEPRVLIDPATLGRGAHATIEVYRPSPDGNLVAYNLNQGDSEVTSIHVLPVRGGSELPDVVERVWGETPALWLPDASGFFYRQMALPAAGVDPMLGMRVRLHRLGQPISSDPTLLGPGVGAAFPIEASEFPAIEVPDGSNWMIASYCHAQPECRLAVAPLSALRLASAEQIPWKVVAGYADGVENYTVHGERLYLIVNRDSPNRKVVSLPLSHPELPRATLTLPESPDASIEKFAAAGDALYVVDQRAGRARLRRLAWEEGARATELQLPHAGWISALDADPRRPGALIQLVGWTHPSELLAYDARAEGFVPTGLRAVTAADPSLLVAEETVVRSAGEVDVPLSILHHGQLAHDGSHPTIVYGYGAYANSITPFYSATLSVWLERGGVFAICHVRGGGEKGESWHRAGSRLNKRNGVADLISCAQHLVDEHYTTPARLAVEGRSMGGLLVGRALVERPDLFAAAHLGVGIVNPLRILHAKNGANQVPELGSPETPEGLAGLLDMDPYVHVSAGTAYPAVLFTVGVNDSRVAPWMTGKLAARLQAASSSGKPVLVRVDPDAGHGMGATADQYFAENADVDSFFLNAFEDPAFVPAASR